MNKGLKDIYVKHALNKDYWISKAKELHDSAELLWNDCFEEYTDNNERVVYRTKDKTAILLMAMSLECIIKGYLITSNADYIKDGRLNKKIATHELNDLFKKANIFIDEYQISFLNKLSKSIAWHGRYIIPKKHEHHVLEFFEIVTIEDDLDTFKNLYQIAYEKYE